MSVDEVLKRKSPEEDSNGVAEESNGPQAKLIKNDEEMSPANLKNEDSEQIIDEANFVPGVNEAKSEPTSSAEDALIINEETATCTDSNAKTDDSVSLTEEVQAQNLETTVAAEASDFNPSIRIKFQSDSVAEKYKSTFIKFIQSLMGLQVRREDDSCIDVFEDEAKNGAAPSPSKKRKKHSKAKKELFVFDPTSSPVSAPMLYTAKFKVNTEKGEDKVSPGPKQSTCFNCDEKHALRDCPHPKDFQKINEARQKFRSQPRSGRYHVEEDQKFSHLTPGNISNELRRALDLHKDEVPHYIYSMRRLGYPPGWLEEAKFVHSNLDLFDIDGKNVKAKVMKSRGLDPNKVVSYPGFNVPFDKGVKDDYRKFHVRPFTEECSKDAMINYFVTNCLENEPADIDQDVEEGGDSPSLIDLEQQKQQLLKELNEPKEEIRNEVDLDKDLSSVKTTCFGTPVLKSNSPYLRLPNADNFSKDVSPVINFENLPNSTGKYEQMTDVLQKVRDTLRRPNTCST